MKRCPITYELTDNFYSKDALRQLSPRLKDLKPFSLTSKEQVQRAIEIAEKLSIQGVQPKLILDLNIKKEEFEVIEQGGTYILKPPHPVYNELPENEDLSMKLANVVGIKVPFHGLIYNIDGSLSYLIKRFDRISRKKKLAVEDFSQLSDRSRDTKYESSMEKVGGIIEQFCTFPAIEKAKLFRRVLFNFLIGNEDMHLKNFSLITREDLVELSPAYDLLNTTIVMNTSEEIALPLRGKKSRLTKSDFFDYYGSERLGLSDTLLKKEEVQLLYGIEKWDQIIQESFLSSESKRKYTELYRNRLKRLKEKKE